MKEVKTVRCNHCMNVFSEESILVDIDLDAGTDTEECPFCHKTDALMDMDEE